jgi:hypothetical protein
MIVAIMDVQPHDQLDGAACGALWRSDQDVRPNWVGVSLDKRLDPLDGTRRAGWGIAKYSCLWYSVGF